MSAASLAAAASTLRRARGAGRVGKVGYGLGRESEVLRGATQRTAAVLGMSAATSAAVTGEFGFDPRLVESVCGGLCSVFESHGAVRLRSPLLRPRLGHAPEVSGVGGPAEVMSRDGTVLLLPEDLTANFARAVSRGGTAASHIKRYDIDKVYHRALAGGHPRESLEASFDIVFEDQYAKVEFLEAETIVVLCQALASGLFSSGECTECRQGKKANHGTVNEYFNCTHTLSLKPRPKN